MTEEVGRRLIDGVWVTNVESQGGGGGGGITRVTSDDETVTITNPTGRPSICPRAAVRSLYGSSESS